MPAPVRDDVPGAAPGVTDPSTHRRRAWFLLAVAVWNLWLWATRIWNLMQDETPRTTGFVVVHAVLYTASIVVAVAVGWVGWQMWREARAGR